MTGKAEQYLIQDTKMIGPKLAGKITGLLRKYVAAAGSADELAEEIKSNTPNAKMEYLVAQALLNLGQEAGLPRNGGPTLADNILDQQYAKVRRYGENSYRLSEKQIAVIARQVWGYLKPIF